MKERERKKKDRERKGIKEERKIAKEEEKERDRQKMSTKSSAKFDDQTCGQIFYRNFYKFSIY